MERNQLNHVIRFTLIALLLTIYIVAGGASIAGITIYLALLSVVAVICIMDITTYTSSHWKAYEKKLLYVCILILIFIGLSFAINFIDVSAALNRVLLIACCMSFSFFCGNILRDTEAIKKVVWLVIISTTISALVVIGQGLDISVAYQIPKMFGGGSELEDFQLSLESERYYGLAKSALYFGYQASATIALLLFMPQSKGNKRGKILRILSFVVIILALLFNRTRTALLSVVVILIVKMIYSGRLTFNRRIFLRTLILTLFIMVGIVYVISKINLDNLILAFRFNELNHTGATARLPMFLTAINSGLHHPLGMGLYRAEPDYLIGITNLNQIEYVLNNACHNLFANCVGNHGLVTGCLLIILYICSFKECNFLRKNLNGELHEIVIGVELVIGVLLINAAMHNLYIFSGDLLTWFAFGILIAIEKKSLT